MIALRPVEPTYDNAFLYALLNERTPEQSISHKRMPTWEEHCRFVSSKPYLAWYIISNVIDYRYVGSIYLSARREVGVSISVAQRRKGYARVAVALLRDLHPGPILANVNPANEPSRNLWESLGGKLIQVTYEL